MFKKKAIYGSIKERKMFGGFMEIERSTSRVPDISLYHIVGF